MGLNMPIDGSQVILNTPTGGFTVGDDEQP